MLDVLTYFRAEIETVGRNWRDLVAHLPEDLAVRRPCQNMNHVLWLTGHMAWAEDYLIVEVPTGQSFRKKEWDWLFDHSSEKMEQISYPAWKEVRAEYTRVHAEVLRHLSRVGYSALSRPSAAEKNWFPTAAHSIAHQVTHGHYHLGQLVYLSKLLTQENVLRASESTLAPKV